MNEVSLGVKKIFKGHTRTINNLLYYPPETLISCCDDSSVAIWNVRTGEQLACHRDHNSLVNSLCDWNSELFISGASDYHIMIYTTKPPYVLDRKFMNINNSFIARVERVSDNHILSVDRSHGIYLIPFHQPSEVKRMTFENVKIHYESRIVLSKLFKNCVYINSSRGLSLINYVEEKMIKSWERDKETNSVFVSSTTQGNERIIVGGHQLISIIVMSTDFTELSVTQKTLDLEIGGFSMEPIQNDFFIYGLYDGKLSFTKNNSFEVISKSLELELDETEDPINSKIFDIKLRINEDKKLVGNDSVTAFVAAHSRIFMIEIRGLVFPKDDLVLKDLTERIEFLWTEKEYYVFNNEDLESQMFLRIKTSSFDDSFCKILFL